MIPLDWIKIDSTHIAKVKYDPIDRDEKNGVSFLSPSLHVEFKTGKKYKFKDIPQHKVESLVHHTSPGSYFGDHIRGHHDAIEIK